MNRTPPLAIHNPEHRLPCFALELFARSTRVRQRDCSESAYVFRYFVGKQVIDGDKPVNSTEVILRCSLLARASQLYEFAVRTIKPKNICYIASALAGLERDGGDGRLSLKSTFDIYF